MLAKGKLRLSRAVTELGPHHRAGGGKQSRGPEGLVLVARGVNDGAKDAFRIRLVGGAENRAELRADAEMSLGGFPPPANRVGEHPQPVSLELQHELRVGLERL